MQNKVFIRVDGSAEIGLGHIVRCLALSHMLKENFTIHFFSKKIPDANVITIIRHGFQINKIKSEEEFFLQLNGSEIVVLDSYDFDSAYQKRIKEMGSKLVCIDDFHNQYFYADIVINHAPNITEAYYDGEPYTEYLLGPDYALLRPEFLESTSKKKENVPDKIKNIFICFGGSPAKNLTAKVLSWLPSNDYSVTVVLGNTASHQDLLNKVIEERRDLEIILKDSLSAKEMKLELEKTDLAIVPASGILFEVISTRLPVISGYYTDNQKAIYKGFLEEGVIIDANSFSKKSFKEAFNKLGSHNFGAIVSKQHKLIDSNIKNRVKNKFLELC